MALRSSRPDNPTLVSVPATVEDSATTQVVLAFDDNRLASMLFGQYGQNLALIERRLGVVADQRGNHVTVEGSRDAVEQARRVLEGLYERLKRGDELASGDVDGAIRLAIAQGSLFDYDPTTARPSFEEINLRKRPVRARTTAQDAYIRALRRHALVFAAGPAGTGKTWLAVAHAVQLFERKEVDRIVLSRPAVEAGERLGFLPGDMREKVDPYLRPIYDALYDLMDARIVERAMQSGEFEIAPLAFMRGRTLSNAVVILDEAQNTTSMQMKMFLTRLGENSRMIVTGDPSQVDLPNGQTSGLHEAMRLLRDVEGIGHVTFSAQDVVRHELVAPYRRRLRPGGAGVDCAARECGMKSACCTDIAGLDGLAVEIAAVNTNAQACAERCPRSISSSIRRSGRLRRTPKRSCSARLRRPPPRCQQPPASLLLC